MNDLTHGRLVNGIRNSSRVEPEVYDLKGPPPKQRGLWSFLTWSFFLSEIVSAHLVLSGGALAKGDDAPGDADKALHDQGSQIAQLAANGAANNASADDDQNARASQPHDTSAAPAGHAQIGGIIQGPAVVEVIADDASQKSASTLGGGWIAADGVDAITDPPAPIGVLEPDPSTPIIDVVSHPGAVDVDVGIQLPPGIAIVDLGIDLSHGVDATLHADILSLASLDSHIDLSHGIAATTALDVGGIAGVDLNLSLAHGLQSDVDVSALSTQVSLNLGLGDETAVSASVDLPVLGELGLEVNVGDVLTGTVSSLPLDFATAIVSSTVGSLGDVANDAGAGVLDHVTTTASDQIGAITGLGSDVVELAASSLQAPAVDALASGLEYTSYALALQAEPNVAVVQPVVEIVEDTTSVITATLDKVMKSDLVVPNLGQDLGHDGGIASQVEHLSSHLHLSHGLI